MHSLFSYISSINEQINRFIWGPWMLIIFLAVGLLFTVRTGFFQVRGYKLWLHTTILSAFHKDKKKKKMTVLSHHFSPYVPLWPERLGLEILPV